jgi:hypothetical protein
LIQELSFKFEPRHTLRLRALKKEERDPNQDHLKAKTAQFSPKHHPKARPSFLVTPMQFILIFILEIDTSIVLEEGDKSLDHTKRKEKELFKSGDETNKLELIVEVEK